MESEFGLNFQTQIQNGFGLDWKSNWMKPYPANTYPEIYDFEAVIIQYWTFINIIDTLDAIHSPGALWTPG